MPRLLSCLLLCLRMPWEGWSQRCPSALSQPSHSLHGLLWLSGCACCTLSMMLHCLGRLTALWV